MGNPAKVWTAAAHVCRAYRCTLPSICWHQCHYSSWIYYAIQVNSFISELPTPQSHR